MHVAVAVLVVAGNPKQDLVVDDRDVHCAQGFRVTVVAGACREEAAKVVRRFGARDQDGAACIVTAEQRALRTFQDLY